MYLLVFFRNLWLLMSHGCLSLVVYDVTRRETFTNLSDVWAKELELYSTNQDCLKMLVGNKVDRVSLFSLIFISWFTFMPVGSLYVV